MTRALVFGGVVVLLAAGAFLVAVREEPVSFADEESVEKSFARDAEGTWRELVATGKDLDYSDAHALTHVAGDALYRNFGIDGVGYCGPEFGYGCYHGAAGAALEAEGLDAAPRLRESCMRPGHGFFLGCIHGIGHGILVFLGNEELARALKACEPVQGEETIGGCWGGVFMEYNFNTMQSTDGIAPRPFESDAAHEPCDSLETKYAPACYYEQPSWWRVSFAIAARARGSYIKETGALCDGVSESSLRDICFRGVGNVVGPQAGYDEKMMRAWCGEIADDRGRELCLHEAFGHLLQSEGGRMRLAELCAEGDPAARELCSTYDE